MEICRIKDWRCAVKYDTFDASSYHTLTCVLLQSSAPSAPKKSSQQTNMDEHNTYSSRSASSLSQSPPPTLRACCRRSWFFQRSIRSPKRRCRSRCRPDPWTGPWISVALCKQPRNWGHISLRSRDSGVGTARLGSRTWKTRICEGKPRIRLACSRGRGIYSRGLSTRSLLCGRRRRHLTR